MTEEKNKDTLQRLRDGMAKAVQGSLKLSDEEMEKLRKKHKEEKGY